jgi:hypothetical protein
VYNAAESGSIGITKSNEMLRIDLGMHQGGSEVALAGRI